MQRPHRLTGLAPGLTDTLGLGETAGLAETPGLGEAAGLTAGLTETPGLGDGPTPAFAAGDGEPIAEGLGRGPI